MADKVQHHRSFTAGTEPTTLLPGEIGINVTDKRLWVGDADSVPVELDYALAADIPDLSGYLPLTGGRMAGAIDLNRQNLDNILKLNGVSGYIMVITVAGLQRMTLSWSDDIDWYKSDGITKAWSWRAETDLLIASSDLSLGNNNIINLADPVAAQEAATKAYVDAGDGLFSETSTLICGDADGVVGYTLSPYIGSITPAEIVEEAVLVFAADDTDGLTIILEFRDVTSLPGISTLNTTFNNGSDSHIIPLVFDDAAGIYTAESAEVNAMLLASISGSPAISVNFAYKYDYATEQYVDDSIAAIPPPDLSGYLPLAGGEMTGDLEILSDSPSSGPAIRGTGSAGVTIKTAANEYDVNVGVNGLSVTSAGSPILQAYTGNVRVHTTLEMFNNTGITNVLDPVAAQDAATKNYVDTVIAAIPPPSGFLPLGGGTMSGPIHMSAQAIDSLGSLISYNASFLIRNNSTTIANYDGSSWDFIDNKLINILDPVDAQDAATKNYVDNSIAAIPPGGTGDFMADGSVPMTGIFESNGTISSTNTGLYLNASGVKRVSLQASDQLFYMADGLNTWLKWSEAAGEVQLRHPLSVGFKKIIDLDDPVDDADAATKAYVDSKIAAIPPGGTGDFMADGTVPMIGSLDISGEKIINVFRFDLAGNFNITDSLGQAALMYISNSTWDFQGKIVTGLPAPSAFDDAATKAYVDDSIEDIAPPVSGYLPLSGGDMIGSITFGEFPLIDVGAITAPNGGRLELNTYVATGPRISMNASYISLLGGNIILDATKITEMADPTSAQDAATKIYVDNSIAAIPVTPGGWEVTRESANFTLAPTGANPRLYIIRAALTVTHNSFPEFGEVHTFQCDDVAFWNTTINAVVPEGKIFAPRVAMSTFSITYNQSGTWVAYGDLADATAAVAMAPVSYVDAKHTQQDKTIKALEQQMDVLTTALTNLTKDFKDLKDGIKVGK